MAVFVTGDIHGWLDIGKLTPERWPQGTKCSRILAKPWAGES